MLNFDILEYGLELFFYHILASFLKKNISDVIFY